MNKNIGKKEIDASKRKFIKKLAYVPPVVMTLSAVPSHATTGSPRHKDYDKKNHKDNKHKKNDNHKYKSKKNNHFNFR